MNSFRSRITACFVIVYLIMSTIFISCADNKAPEQTPQSKTITEEHLDYFSTALTEKSIPVASNADTIGLGSGVNGFLLRKAFPNLVPADFEGVLGRQGNYSVRNGELSFEGNAASTSANLTEEGFKRLLENCSNRLKIPVTGRRDVDTILSRLSGGQTDSMGGSEQKAGTWDAVYKKYIPLNLKDYIIKNHPGWSIPDRYRWHPNLFDKYRTENAVPPIVSGDFDCNGSTDYALLMDKNKKGLAVMLFLGNGPSFSSQILTQNLVHDVPKIEYVLSIVKPGVYKTIDPDREADSPPVKLQCPSIGIGLFKELYDGSRDVYYFDKGELKSCLIDNTYK
ncbi:MAG: hypothetical protein JWP69_1734 [Flaviaesturariibacter sp.]|nr:hypothetical protein [Flaviaesturariibacter sp.]